MPAIICHEVRRSFGGVHAVDGVDLTIDEHQIFGLLGPNGSGKTTLLNLLQGIDRPTAGEVSVLGLDPIRDWNLLAPRMGTQLQEATLIPRLTVREALSTFASFYPHARDVDEVLGELGLTDKATSRVEKLSGGQRQRVFIALALLHDPELIFFDELTSAVDPRARHAIWDILRNLARQGRTIVLTTHSMEEAQALCDRIAIIDAGRIIAEGAPSDLIAEHAGGSRLLLRADGVVDEDALLDVDGVSSVGHDRDHLVVTGTGQFAARVMADLSARGAVVTDMSMQDATFEDVFLALTGRTMREGE